VMQAIGHKKLKDNTTAGSIYHHTLLCLLFHVRMQKKVAHDFRYDPRTMSVTHPTARTQDISTCRPFSAGANGSSTQGSLLFLIHRSILLKHDARYPVVHSCHRKCLLEVDVEMTQDATVK